MPRVSLIVYLKTQIGFSFPPVYAMRNTSSPSYLHRDLKCFFVQDWLITSDGGGGFPCCSLSLQESVLGNTHALEIGWHGLWRFGWSKFCVPYFIVCSSKMHGCSITTSHHSGLYPTPAQVDQTTLSRHQWHTKSCKALQLLSNSLFLVARGRAPPHRGSNPAIPAPP